TGGYRIYYRTRNPDDPHGEQTDQTLEAKKVVLAGGVVGTVEILLRSREKNTLPHLSNALGRGFSTNGDYIGFVQNTREPVRLVKGPVTTSYAFYNPGHAPDASAEQLFHTIEDNGIPPALPATIGFGLELAGDPPPPPKAKGIGHQLARRIGTGRHQSSWMVLWLWLRLALRRFGGFFRNLWRERTERTRDFVSEDEF